MKNVVTVTLGASKHDFTLKTEFLGEHFTVKRMGTDGDHRKAWDLLRRQQRPKWQSRSSRCSAWTSWPCIRNDRHRRR